MIDWQRLLRDVSQLRLGKGAVELNLGHRHGPLEEIPLQRAYARQSQQSALIGGFHSFGRRCDVETVRERQCRRNDCGAICALGQVLRK